MNPDRFDGSIESLFSPFPLCIDGLFPDLIEVQKVRLALYLFCIKT